MSDKLNLSFYEISFADGEWPSAAKFTAITAEVAAAVESISYALGDLNGESYPYSADSSNTFYSRWGRNGASAVLLSESTGREIDIINLARLIGPAGNLNPEFLDATASITGESVPTGVYEFNLRYRPDTPSAVTFSDGTAFATYKANKAALEATGDYHVSASGRVYVYAVTAGGTCDYDTTATNYNGGAGYCSGEFNRIPDANQIANGGDAVVATGPDVNGLYTLQLPTISHQQRNYLGTTAALSAAVDYNFGQQLKLPESIVNNLSVGEVIPRGLVVLKDESTGELYLNATYVYSSADELKIQGVELDTGNDFSLLTSGTNITSAIDDLRYKFAHHTHDRSQGDKAVHIEDIVGAMEEAGGSGSFVPSEIAGNYFPQYLHRDGSTATIDTTNKNDANAMRGHLVIGREFTDVLNATPATAGSYLGADGLTFSVAFGDLPGTGNAPEIFRRANGDFVLQGLTGSIVEINGDDLEITLTDLLTIAVDEGTVSFGDDGSTNVIFDFVGAVTTSTDKVMRVWGKESGDDVLQLWMTHDGTPSLADRWLVFRSDSDVGGAYAEKGGVRAIPTLGDNVFVSLSGGAESHAAYDNGDTSYVTGAAAGDAQFYSGGADFGEWIGMGDPEEWGAGRLPEGMIVYVREDIKSKTPKFYKNNPGRPMVVTHSALIVGNHQPMGRGEILSFIGQVNVLFVGAVEDGMLAMPYGNYCVGVHKENIDFIDYTNCIGTIWGSNNDKRLKRVICAIGVK